jgi:hypothetical protein
MVDAPMGASNRRCTRSSSRVKCRVRVSGAGVLDDVRRDVPPAIGQQSPAQALQALLRKIGWQRAVAPREACIGVLDEDAAVFGKGEEQRSAHVAHCASVLTRIDGARRGAAPSAAGERQAGEQETENFHARFTASRHLPRCCARSSVDIFGLKMLVGLPRLANVVGALPEADAEATEEGGAQRWSSRCSSGAPRSCPARRPGTASAGRSHCAAVDLERGNRRGPSRASSPRRGLESATRCPRGPRARGGPWWCCGRYQQRGRVRRAASVERPAPRARARRPPRRSTSPCFASASTSLAFLMIFSPSRSHCTAAPAMNELPSSA